MERLDFAVDAADATCAERYTRIRLVKSRSLVPQNREVSLARRKKRRYVFGACSKLKIGLLDLEFGADLRVFRSVLLYVLPRFSTRVGAAMLDFNLMDIKCFWWKVKIAERVYALIRNKN